MRVPRWSATRDGGPFPQGKFSTPPVPRCARTRASPTAATAIACYAGTQSLGDLSRRPMGSVSRFRRYLFRHPTLAGTNDCREYCQRGLIRPLTGTGSLRNPSANSTALPTELEHMYRYGEPLVP